MSSFPIPTVWHSIQTWGTQSGLQYLSLSAPEPRPSAPSARTFPIMESMEVPTFTLHEPTNIIISNGVVTNG